MNTTVQSTNLIHAKVVGVSYDNRQLVAARLAIGEVVYLVRDPLNPFDHNAIKVEKKVLNNITNNR